jgi:hypothetical protein
MIDYRPYLDSTSGINPEIGASSFNNVVYLVGLAVGMKFGKELGIHNQDLREYEVLYEDHIALNNDEHGLYKPKNSHDNITMKLAGSVVLGKYSHLFMDLFRSCVGANFHPKDTILYAYCLGNPFVRFIAGFFMFIPAISIILAALSEGKIRPKGYLKDMVLKRPKLFDKIKTKDGWMKIYLYKDGSQKTYRLHQNDGKILSFYKLLLTCRTNLIMNLTAHVYESIMTKRYGAFYMAELYYNYFPAGWEHPTTAAWYGVSEPLKYIMEKK